VLAGHTRKTGKDGGAIHTPRADPAGAPFVMPRRQAVVRASPTAFSWSEGNYGALLLVAKMEHEDSDTEALCANVELQMAAVLIDNAPSVANRDDFAARMLMSSQARSGTHATPFSDFPDPEDRIGPVQELRLTRPDLNRAVHVGSTRLSLGFRGDD